MAKTKDGLKNKFRALPSRWYPAKKYISGGRHSRDVPESEDRNVVIPSPVRDANPTVVTIDAEINSYRDTHCCVKKRIYCTLCSYYSCIIILITIFIIR